MFKKRMVINSFFTALTILSFVNVVYSSEAGPVESEKSDFEESIAKKMLADLVTRVYQQDLADSDQEKNLRHLIYFDSKMQALGENKQIKEEYEKHWYSFLQEMKKEKEELKQTDFNENMEKKFAERILYQSPGFQLAKMLISPPKEEYKDPRPFKNFVQKKEQLLFAIDACIGRLEKEGPASNFDKIKILLSRYRSLLPTDAEGLAEKVESWAPKSPKDFVDTAGIINTLVIMTGQNGLLMSNDDMMNLSAQNLARPLGYFFSSPVSIEHGGSVDVDETSGRMTVMSKEETAKNLADASSDVEQDMTNIIENLSSKAKIE